MSNIYPQIDTSVLNVTNKISELPIPYEYAWDFDNNDFLLVEGKEQIVSRDEAIKIWCWKALQIDRYKYLAYSWNYGQELNTLIGKGLSREVTQSETERIITETLKVNPYVSEVKDFSYDYSMDKMTVTFTIVTIYGEVNLSV